MRMGSSSTCRSAAASPMSGRRTIVGDSDGILVVPAEKAAEVAVQAADLDELELEQERAVAQRLPLPELMAVLAKKKKLKS